MWPFQSRYSAHIQTFASLLDTVVTEVLGKMSGLQKAQFVLGLQEDRNVEEVTEPYYSQDRVDWRDKRLAGFMFMAHFEPQEWWFTLMADASYTKPSFVGIMLTVKCEKQTQNATKSVSVHNYMMVKATSAAKALAELLSSNYGYRHLLW